jgi:elongation factor Ts
MGTAAALVGLRVDPKIAETPAARATVEQFGKRLAMHVVAARPRFLDVGSIPAEVVEHERKIIREQAAGSGKPEAIIAKMTEGKLNKFLGELTLLEQAHMIEEGNPKVKDLLEPLSQELKGSVGVAGFVRVRCGEEVEQ